MALRGTAVRACELPTPARGDRGTGALRALPPGRMLRADPCVPNPEPREAAVNVSYTAPLRAAWARMRALLFSPFRLETWLVAGLAAFLASLAQGPLFGSYGSRWRSHDRWPGQGDASEAVERVRHFLENPAVLLMLALALIAFAVIYAVVLWASARAQFVFLDNVATGRAEFGAPWRRHAATGRSLFLFWAAFSFAWLVPLALGIAALLPVARTWYEGRPASLFALAAPAVALLALAGLAVLAIAFVSLLLGDFVVPLMWRHGEGAVAAWARFRPLFAAHAGDFVAYALFVFVLGLATIVAIVLAGFATLCVGFLLLAIPYVGSVVMLPVTATFRGLGPEFLAQYGPEWDVLAEHRAPPAE